ncbi:hypothetical protein AVEN_97569-1 [Araneus ventricosus]|uniref:Uncharacterized protein n=1 Tax=Araneus ventricosus TaxID=182803 RepID=A0A4Y2F3T4_ARAVE|nr:hypothetical protein AVEN_97569-1 [Araneus ventricosus]
MKRQNSFDVSNPAGSGRIEIGAGLQSLGTDRQTRHRYNSKNAFSDSGMQKEEYEEWISIDEDIPTAATLTDLEICQVVCEQYQATKVNVSDGDECVEENPPKNAELRQALDILKSGV